MNFIQQAYKGKNDWWRYLLGILLIFFGWQVIGIAPILFVAIAHASDMNALQRAAADNFMSLGIDSNLYLFSMIMMFAIGLVFIFLAVKQIHKRSITSVLTSRKKLDWKRVFFAFGIWFVISFVILAIDYFGNPEVFVWNFKLIPFLILSLISLLLLPFQTSFEEVLFRGYLMQGIAHSTTINKNILRLVLHLASGIIVFIIYLNFDTQIFGNIILFFGFVLLFELTLISKKVEGVFDLELFKLAKKFLNRKWYPLVITSVSFGLLHGFNPEIEKLGYMVLIYYIGTGFLFGITTLMDEGIELSLGMHAANNIVAAMFVTTNWTVFQTDALFIDTSEPSLGMEMYVPVFIIYPILLFVFSKKYGWKNWQGKLFGKIEKPIIPQEDISPISTRLD